MRHILLGEIASVHGIRGEVVVRSYTGDPAAIGDYGPLADGSGTRTFQLRVVRVTPKGVIARVAGISDRTAAEALRGTKLFVARDRLPPAEEGEYYHADLIGLRALTPTGDLIGEVVAVQDFGAGDLIEIRRAGEARTDFIPFNDDFVPTVDLAAGTLVVLPPTYIEPDADSASDIDSEPGDEAEPGQVEPRET